MLLKVVAYSLSHVQLVALCNLASEALASLTWLPHPTSPPP